jgi:subtilisin family serine protease/methionine-rich copper-binding protein CopC
MLFRKNTDSRRHGRPTNAPNTKHTALGLESLEDRCVPSATTTPSQTIDLSGLQTTGTYASDNILVQFKSGVTPTALAGTTIGTALPLVNNLYQVNLNSGVTVAQALAEYQKSSEVAIAEADAELTVSSNDPNFSTQTNLGSAPGGINATSAWNTTTGSSSVTVAVMDSGIDYNHPDLADNVWINQAEIPRLAFAPGTGLTGSRYSLLESINHGAPITFAELNNKADQGLGKITDVNGDGIIDAGDILAPMQTVTINGKVYDTGKGGWAYNGNTQDGDTAHPNDVIGWNFANNTNNPFDDNGHGTHVSGILGAVGNNGIGVAGVDWNVSIMPVKFLDSSGQGSVSNFIEGLNYAVQHGAKISNNSWTGASGSQMLYDAIANAQSHGMIFVAAAGNNSSNNDTNPVYPANTPLNNVVSVAATDQTGNLASFSDYGAKTVDLAAPGVNILSTLPGGKYGYDSGTSMATPEVTGALALVWSEHPTWNYTQVINQVLATVTKESSLSGKVATAGILNVGAAVGSVNAASIPAVTGVTLTQPNSSTITGATITFNQAMNVSTLNGNTVTIVGPNGKSYPATKITAVAGSGNKSFTISFATLTTPGTYTVELSGSIRSSANVALPAFKRAFTLAAPTPPTPTVTGVTLTEPNSYTITGATITFSQSMNLSTLTGSTVTLVGPNGKSYGATKITAVAGSDNKTFTVTFPTQATPGTYTVELSGSIRSSANAALSAYKRAFTLAAAPKPTAPTVTNVSLIEPNSYTITGATITFSQAMNVSTLNGSDITIVGPNGKSYGATKITAVAGSGNKSFTVTFGTLTTPGTYTVELSGSIRSSANVALSGYKRAFTLAAAPKPTAPTVTNVTLTEPNSHTVTGATITFSQAMNVSTLTGSTVTVIGPDGKSHQALWIGAVANSGNRSFAISFGTLTTPGTYTIELSNGIRSSANVSLSAYKRSFTLTAPALAPTVTSVKPTEPNPSTLTGMTITFSQSMNVSTITAANLSLVGPDGKAHPVTKITDVAGSDNKTFAISFGTLTAPGNYYFKVGTGVRSSANVALSSAFKGVYTLVAPAPTAPTVTGLQVQKSSSGALTGVVLTFNEAMNPSTLTGSTITVIGPNGKSDPVTWIGALAGSDNKKFAISFGTQTTKGTYKIELSTSVRSSTGVALKSTFVTSYTLTT